MASPVFATGHVEHPMPFVLDVPVVVAPFSHHCACKIDRPSRFCGTKCVKTRANPQSAICTMVRPPLGKDGFMAAFDINNNLLWPHQ